MLRLSPKQRIDDSVYQQKLNSMKVLQTPGGTKNLSRTLGILLFLALIILFLPWQQNIRSEGELTALSPSDRPQTVETAIAGRIVDWRVSEGQFVGKGDTLVQIAEIKDKYFDPQLLTRLQEQVNAKKGVIDNKKGKVDALNRQINALKAGLTLKLSQTEKKIIQKKLKIEMDSNDLVAVKTLVGVAQRQVGMYQNLYDSGLVALTKLESAQIKVQEAKAKVVSAQNKLDASRNDYLIEVINLSTIEAEAFDKISKAESDKSATLAEISDSEASLAKLTNELANMTIRNQQYNIVAPQDGFIVKALKSGIGETVKEQEALLTIMPNEPELAVALYVKAMDVPLLQKNRHVRLQFDGWPVIQFSGWPSVSVGTFGGKVSVIDRVNSKGGKYRVLITPDYIKGDEEWPEQLRLGSGVRGWVMLDDVPVYYELWRQLNGFPPTITPYTEGTEKGEADQKALKYL